jgi:hypothetical protein
VTDLPPGAELDRLVAEKVMGYTVAGEESRPLRFVQMGDTLHPEHVPKFSTMIACAWKVVETMEAKGYEANINRYFPSEWEAYFNIPERVPCESGHAETVYHAICIAALKAVQE